MTLTCRVCCHFTFLFGGFITELMQMAAVIEKSGLTQSFHGSIQSDMDSLTHFLFFFFYSIQPVNNNAETDEHNLMMDTRVALLPFGFVHQNVICARDIKQKVVLFCSRF